MPSFKLFKILASFLCISLGFLYVLYLIYLPKIIDEKKIEDLINIQLAKNTKFSLDATNLKIYPNYKFDIVLKADELKLKYPTKKDMLVLNNPVIDVSLLSLTKSNIDLNKIKADSVYLNTNFTKTKRYSCFNYIDKEFFITSKNNSKFKLRRVNLVAQKFVFNLYDENISKNFSVKTNKFKLNLNDIDKPFIISTKGVIFSSNHKISDFILNLEFKPYKTKVSKFKEKLYNLNYNPLIHADKYKMYSKTEANLKIISSSKTKNITGFVKLNKFSFDINNQRLPENNLLVLFKGDKIITDCDFNLIKEQFIKIKTNVNISKNKFIELSLKANSVNLSDLKIVLDAFLKIFNSKIQAEEFSLSGFLDADIYLKSNFKTIVSNGRLNIKNAILSHRKIGIKLDRINSNINLANNKIDILNTTAFIDNAKFYLSGQIDNNANLSLKINSDLLNIAQIIKLLEQLKFASSFKDELNEYKFNSGMLKILAEVKGTIKNPVITTNSKLQKFDVIKNDFHILIDEALITANPVQSKVDSIDITLFKTKFFNKNIDAFIPKMDVLINKTDIIIPKTSLNIFNANGFIQAKIKNYNSKTLAANILLELIDIEKNKFFTLNNKNVKLILDAQVAQNKLRISNGLLKDNVKELAKVNGNILNIYSKPEFDNLRILIPDKIGILIPKSNNLKFNMQGNIILSGLINTPKLNGNLIIDNLKYSELNIFVKDIILNLKNSVAYLNITNGQIADYNFDLVSQIRYVSNKIIFDFFEIASPYINTDIFTKLQTNTTSKNNLFEINNLRGNIATLEAMNILFNNVNFKGELKNDLLNISSFSSNVFDGDISGTFKIDIRKKITDAGIILKNINVRHISNELKELSIAASGRLNAVIDAQFFGFDYENMIKTLDGYLKFNINDGELNQFAKLERFLQAGNILSQSFLKLSLNSVVSALSKQNTGYFKLLEGNVRVKNSWAEINYLKSQGTNMSLYLTGKFNLLSQYCDIKVLGKIPSSVVKVMGNIGNFSTNKLVDKMNEEAQQMIKTITASPFEKKLSVAIPNDEINNIPSLVNQSEDIDTREFIVFIEGVLKNSSSVKYFKWNLKE